jgi:hypothetical protein
MDKENYFYEVIKEFVVEVEGFDENIKLKIIKSDDDGRYKWETSHYYKLDSSAAGVYIPSRNYAKTYEECYQLMRLYCDGFCNIKIEANTFY